MASSRQRTHGQNVCVREKGLRPAVVAAAFLAAGFGIVLEVSAAVASGASFGFHIALLDFD